MGGEQERLRKEIEKVKERLRRMGERLRKKKKEEKLRGREGIESLKYTNIMICLLYFRF